jgi:peroxiredoxin
MLPDINGAIVTPEAPGQQSPRKARGAIAKGIQTLTMCLAIGVLLQNVVLQRQNKNLKEAQSKMISIEEYSKDLDSQIIPGQRLRDVAGATLDGKFRDIGLDSGSSPGSVILTFSPGCVHCVHNQEGWVALAARLKSLGWRVIWISRDSQKETLEYCETHGIALSDVIADPTSRTYDQLALHAVPFTVVTDAKGTIQHVWRGELGQSWHAVFAYFQLTEPASLAAVEKVPQR